MNREQPKQDKKVEEEEKKKLKTKREKDQEDLAKRRKDIESKVIHGMTLTQEGKWIKAPGRNKKCHCNSGDRYKNCCQRKDEERIQSEMIKGTDEERRKKERDVHINAERLDILYI